MSDSRRADPNPQRLKDHLKRTGQIQTQACLLPSIEQGNQEASCDGKVDKHSSVTFTRYEENLENSLWGES